jgi:hypothetical protein
MDCEMENGVHPDFLKTSHVISYMGKVGAYIVRPSNDDQLIEWLDGWVLTQRLNIFIQIRRSIRWLHRMTHLSIIRITCNRSM